MKKNLKNNNWKLCIAAFKIEFYIFITSAINIFYSFLLPLLFMFIWLLIKKDDPLILASVIGTIISGNALYSYFKSIYKKTNGNVLQKLNYISKNNKILLIVPIIFNFIVTIISMGLIIMLALIFFSQQINYLKNMNVFVFLLGVFLMWLMCVLISLLIHNYISSKSISYSLVIFIYTLIYNLLGCAFPFYIILRHDVLNILLYCVPLRYPMNIIQIGWLNASDLIYYGSVGTKEIIIDFGYFNKLYFVVILCIISIMIFYILILFRKISLNKKVYIINNYKNKKQLIKKIRKTKDKKELEILYYIINQKK